MSRYFAILERGLFGHVDNISSGKRTKMTDIADHFMSIAGEQHIRSRLRERELTKARGASLVIHSDKLQTQLGWAPTVEWPRAYTQMVCGAYLWSSKFGPHYMAERTDRSFMVDDTRNFIPVGWMEQETKQILSGIG